MTNRTTAQRPARNYDTDAPRAGRPGSRPQPSIRGASLVAGIGLLAMTAVAIFANFVVLEGLVTPGNAATTARDVMASETMFRLGILGWFAIAVLDVVVAWALFQVFAPVDAGISRLSAWLRLAYAGVLMVAAGELVGALRLLDGGQHLAVFSAEQLQANALLRIGAFTDLFDAGLILFGLHLLAVGYLAYRSGYVPRVVGVLLGVAGIGYVVDSVTAILGQPTNVGAVTFIGEFLLALWLVIWGRRVLVTQSSRDEIVAVAR